MTAEAASTGQLCQWLRFLVPKVAAVGAGVHLVRPIARSWGLAAYVAELSFSSPRPPATASGSLGLFSVDSEAGPYYQEVGCVRDLCRVAAATNLHLTMYTPNWGWALQAKADISVLSSSTATRCHGLVAR